MEEREQKRAAFYAGLQRGIDDADAGRVHDADEVFDELLARYAYPEDGRDHL